MLYKNTYNFHNTFYTVYLQNSLQFQNKVINQPKILIIHVQYSYQKVTTDPTIKEEESRSRPGVAQRVVGGLGSQISWHSAREGSEVVSLTHRPPLPPGMFLLSRPKGHGTVRRKKSHKNPVTPRVNDPGTVRLVAQRLNHYATPGPTDTTVASINL